MAQQSLTQYRCVFAQIGIRRCETNEAIVNTATQDIVVAITQSDAGNGLDVRGDLHDAMSILTGEIGECDDPICVDVRFSLDGVTISSLSCSSGLGLLRLSNEMRGRCLTVGMFLDVAELETNVVHLVFRGTLDRFFHMLGTTLTLSFSALVTYA